MKHKFKSIDGAVRRIRELEAIVARQSSLLENFDRQRKLLARLAATGPAFDNPLVIYEAEKLRDVLLRGMGMNPDGTFIKTEAVQHG